jgi:hypothetical protein
MNADSEVNMLRKPRQELANLPLFAKMRIAMQHQLPRS